MYCPHAFAMDERADLVALMRENPLAQLVTVTASGPIATPLPLFFDASEGPHGVLHGHLARANGQWRAHATGEGLAIFMGADAYVSPSFYPSKAVHGKVVPTWNYATVQARGAVTFYEDQDRLLDVVTRLTALNEGGRPRPWAVSDAPEAYIKAQLRGIIGVRMDITSLEGKRKMSQNRDEADRLGVREGLLSSQNPRDRVAGEKILS